ncbi:response regulator [Pleionea sp. CnH1-48]|uniref:response regulator n=1 Tax=Pleionea sp. CnH1-48 TaxID=2954494 RepID=UPI0020984B34|nr:response regulator [Pleionea sp. CnH1-48]
MLKIHDLTILLVEPSSTQRKIIINNLETAGVDKVDGVESGQRALEELEKFVPDLVISAMYFEDMDAAKLIHSMREKPELSSVPFMLVSSETRFGMIDPVRQAGVVAVLPKPFEAADLKRALDNTINFLEPDELELENYDATEIRVLVVDDSRMARKFICRTLTDMGIQHITQADGGDTAIDILKDSYFDLIVTDYNMPEVDGKALVEFIRSSETHLHVPVLMVTSEQSRAVLNNIEQVGVSAICDKPFESDHVKQLLMQIMK